MDVGVEGDDDDIRQNVQSADEHQYVGVLHRNLLGNLHHHEDDYQVGTIASISSLRLRKMGEYFIHLRTDSHCE